MIGSANVRGRSGGVTSGSRHVYGASGHRGAPHFFRGERVDA
jgi:hypothetical protein